MLDDDQTARNLKKVRVVIAALSTLALITTGLVYWVADEVHDTADPTECARVYPLPVCAEMGDCVWDYQSCTYVTIER
ncbi:hypothetical protein BH789_gp109 [Gordonia phage GMA6]|uniref:Transmembrane protein n=1 Tax=Gordonia phage GMA6 TaxID=1647285 RepID=A0A0K0NKY3_9CAUD|nr:hypothetical protein BH789_gp109 [Gordonia phage GMA6]AKL88390.1 hypothetical protein GMA6_109 [Gordonia phage GMA6]